MRGLKFEIGNLKVQLSSPAVLRVPLERELDEWNAYIGARRRSARYAAFFIAATVLSAAAVALAFGVAWVLAGIF